MLTSGCGRLAARARGLALGAAALALLMWGAVAIAQTRGHAGAARRDRNAMLRAQPRPSIFGIDTTLHDPNSGHFFDDLPAARRLGARWIRWTLGPGSATGHYGAAGYLAKKAHQYHMGIILSLAGIRRACSERPVPADVRTCPPTTARDRRVYETYLRRMLLHFRREVTYWESWREPNRKLSWAPHPNARSYAKLLQADWATFKSVNRTHHLHLKLLFGSPMAFGLLPRQFPSIAVLRYTQQVLHDLHGRRPFNGAALHAYRFPPGKKGPSAPELVQVGGIPVPRGAHGPFPHQGCNSTPACFMTWPQELSAYEQEFRNHGYGRVPLWLTEFGWPGNKHAHYPFFPSVDTQARYLRQAYADLLRLRFIQGALWFNIRNNVPGYSYPDHYGLLYYDYKRKPAAYAFAALAKAHPDR